MKKLSLLPHANGRGRVRMERQTLPSPGPLSMLRQEKYKLGEAERGRISKDRTGRKDRAWGGCWEKEGADRSEPQWRQQDDNWGPERIALTKKPLEAAGINTRMKERISLARARDIFKTYLHFSQPAFEFSLFHKWVCAGSCSN